MKKLQIVDSGVMFINKDPAYGHVFATHPGLQQLSEKEFVAVYQRGAGLYSVDNTLAMLRSKDGGVTWAEEDLLYDSSEDERPYSYHGGLLSRMSDGALVVLTFRADRSQPDKPLFSDSGGMIDNDPLLFFSDDGGRSWSKPAKFPLPDGKIATPSHPIVELKDGTWLATFDQWPCFEDTGAYRPCMVAFHSRDRGRTWSSPVIMADGRMGDKGYWHGKTIRLQDGRLYTQFWAADMTQPEKGPIGLMIHNAFADETGSKWSVPEPTNIPGQTNWPAQLPDGTLCTVFTVREADPPGIRAVLSVDGGRTWDLDNQVQIWDATGCMTIGINCPDKYPRSHDTIAFGAPTLMTTLEGELYASWWCTHMSLTHLRWARLRVEDK